MPSPITWSFVRDLQPLPPSDRRLLLKELRVGGVDHRDDESFYGWLAERYVRHEVTEVENDCSCGPCRARRWSTG